jgi:hypothetical protein
MVAYLNFRERVNAVWHHEMPDYVPFAPDKHHVHMGSLERELRNMGMGLASKINIFWSEMPNVTIETQTKGNICTTTYHTPVGSVSTKHRMHLQRLQWTQLKWAIEEVTDYDTVIYMIKDTIYYKDDNIFFNEVRDLGVDGVSRMVTGGAFAPPYDQLSHGHLWLSTQKWASEQYVNPHEFQKLLAAMENQVNKVFPQVIDSPAEVVYCGSFSGNYGPSQFEKYCLPFYKKYLPLLHTKEKIGCIHAHALNLKSVKHLISQTGIDVIEAFTPPPVGDLSVAQAREAWGDKTVIWVNFPESIFWQGTKETEMYTTNLLRSDPPGNALVIGFTETGFSGITNDATEHVFSEGIRILAKTINKLGKCPIC